MNYRKICTTRWHLQLTSVIEKWWIFFPHQSVIPFHHLHCNHNEIQRIDNSFWNKNAEKWKRKRQTGDKRQQFKWTFMSINSHKIGTVSMDRTPKYVNFPSNIIPSFSFFLNLETTFRKFKFWIEHFIRSSILRWENDKKMRKFLFCSLFGFIFVIFNQNPKPFSLFASCQSFSFWGEYCFHRTFENIAIFQHWTATAGNHCLRIHIKSYTVLTQA